MLGRMVDQKENEAVPPSSVQLLQPIKAKTITMDPLEENVVPLRNKICTRRAGFSATNARSGYTKFVDFSIRDRIRRTLVCIVVRTVPLKRGRRKS